MPSEPLTSSRLPLVRVQQIGPLYFLLLLRNGEVLGEGFEDQAHAENAARLVNDGEWRSGAESEAA